MRVKWYISDNGCKLPELTEELSPENEGGHKI